MCLVNGIVNKILDLHSLLTNDRLDVVAVTETHLNAEIFDSEIIDNSYLLYRRDRNRHGGGVIVTRRDLLSIRRLDLEVDNTELHQLFQHSKH